MSEKSDDPSSPAGQSGSDRKITKPLMEKRRRARINSCLTELKALLLTNADEKESGRFAKLEKADILELTVKFLRNRQHSATSGNHTALYRAGFNKCMQEISSFLNADDEHSVNLRLKMTTHLTEILCSMERLKEASSKAPAERSNASPVFQVSSSSDEPGSLPNPLGPPSPSTGPSTETGETNSRAKPAPESLDADRFKPGPTRGMFPTAANAGGALFQTAMGGQAEHPLPGVPAYATIPLVPTVVTPGQVLLLVPNNNSNNNSNNNNGKLGFQLPTFTPETLGHVCPPRDCHPTGLTDSAPPNSFSYAAFATADSSVSGAGLSFSLDAPTHVIKPEPQSPSRGACAVLRNDDGLTPPARVTPVSVLKPLTVETPSALPLIQGKSTTLPNPKALDGECKIRNSGLNDSSHGPMWRPW